MAICHILNVTPEWLLSGVNPAGGRVDRQDYYIIDKKTDQGQLIEAFNRISPGLKERIMGYVAAFEVLEKEKMV